MRSVETALAVPDAGQLPPPERLAANTRAPGSFVPATLSVGADPAATVAVTVRGPFADLDRSTAGVATFARDTGAKFTWVALDSVVPDAGGALSFDMPTTVSGELVVTLATDRAFARHGYLARAIVAVGRTAPRAAVVFDAVVTPVQFTLPPARQLKAPLRVLRTNDAEWLPMHLGSSGLALPEPTTHLLFGAGNYELVDPIDPTARQSFVVPAVEPVVISEVLTRPRAGHP